MKTALSQLCIQYSRYQSEFVANILQLGMRVECEGDLGRFIRIAKKGNLGFQSYLIAGETKLSWVN